MCKKGTTDDKQVRLKLFFQSFLTFNHHTLNRLIIIFTSIHLSLPSISTIKRTSSKRINKLRDNTTNRSRISTIFVIHSSSLTSQKTSLSHPDQTQQRLDCSVGRWSCHKRLRPASWARGQGWQRAHIESVVSHSVTNPWVGSASLNGGPLVLAGLDLFLHPPLSLPAWRSLHSLSRADVWSMAHFLAHFV